MAYKRKRLAVIIIAAALMIGILLALAAIAWESAAQMTAAQDAAQVDVVSAQDNDDTPMLPILVMYRDRGVQRCGHCAVVGQHYKRREKDIGRTNGDAARKAPLNGGYPRLSTGFLLQTDLYSGTTFTMLYISSSTTQFCGNGTPSTQ